MKIWIDDVRPAPEGYYWCKSVNEAISKIQEVEYFNNKIYASFSPNFKDPDLVFEIDIDHDAGDYAFDGGDYIKFLDWLEKTGRNYPIRIHSMNPVGVANMRAIIERNGWKEIT